MNNKQIKKHSILCFRPAIYRTYIFNMACMGGCDCDCTLFPFGLYMYTMFSKLLTYLALFWFYFSCVDFIHVLLSKYLGLNSFSKKPWLKIYRNFSYKNL